jgi:prepilin-type processing-associated H-X9-DG protein
VAEASRQRRRRHHVQRRVQSELALQTTRARLRQSPADAVEAADHAVVHPQVAAELEGVAVLFADGHARVRGAHVREDDGGHNLGRQARKVLIVPGGGGGLVCALV